MLPAARLPRWIKCLLILSLLVGVAACGGGGAKAPDGATGGGTTGGGSTAVATISISSSAASISADLPATLTASVKDASGGAVTNKLVTFSVKNGLAVFFPTSGTALTNASGNATITLQAGSIAGADEVTAIASLEGTADTTSAPVGFQVTVAVATGSPASIAFDSAAPSTVAIQGTGGIENSTVKFRVKDTNGNPIENRGITFSFSTAPTGVTLSTLSATSAADGTVSTTVRSGSTPGPIRVKAALQSNPAVFTISSLLVVSTTIPHQNGFTISAATLNLEAFNVDGVETIITALLADRYANRVADDTAVSFRAEGGIGSIGPSCRTVNGACTVTFTSSGIRPANGRLTILATAVGEESFLDTNANGLFDSGEFFTDLGEPFIDNDENGLFNSGFEEFIDFPLPAQVNGNGTRDAGDLQFNGILRTAFLTAPTSLNVSSSLVLVLATGNANITTIPSSITLPGCTDGTGATNTPPFGDPVAVTVTVKDANGNVMPKGTKVEFNTSNGKILNPTTSFTIANSNSNAGTSFFISMRTDATIDATTGLCTNAQASGLLFIKVTSPGGIVTEPGISVTDN